MSVIRGGLLIVTSILLFISFLIALTFLTISLSLTYDNVQKEAVPLLKGVASDKIQVMNTLTRDYGLMQDYCQTYSDYVVTYRENKIILPCNIISQGQEVIIDYGLNKFIESIYFGNYDCGFWQCFNKYSVPFFLMSKQTQKEFSMKFNFSLILIAILCILGFLLSEKRSNFFILLAVLMVLAALPFVQFNWFIGLFGEEIQSLLSIFFNSSFFVFKSVAIIGAILLVIGLVSKFFKFDISTIFARKFKRKKSKKIKKSKKK